METSIDNTLQDEESLKILRQSTLLPFPELLDRPPQTTQSRLQFQLAQSEKRRDLVRQSVRAQVQQRESQHQRTTATASSSVNDELAAAFQSKNSTAGSDPCSEPSKMVVLTKQADASIDAQKRKIKEGLSEFPDSGHPLVPHQGSTLGPPPKHGLAIHPHEHQEKAQSGEMKSPRDQDKASDSRAEEGGKDSRAGKGTESLASPVDGPRKGSWNDLSRDPRRRALDR